MKWAIFVTNVKDAERSTAPGVLWPCFPLPVSGSFANHIQAGSLFSSNRRQTEEIEIKFRLPEKEGKDFSLGFGQHLLHRPGKLKVRNKLFFKTLYEFAVPYPNRALVFASCLCQLMPSILPYCILFWRYGIALSVKWFEQLPY